MIQLDIATNINLTRSIAVIFGVVFMDLSCGIELRNSTVDGQHGIAHIHVHRPKFTCQETSANSVPLKKESFQ